MASVLGSRAAIGQLIPVDGPAPVVQLTGRVRADAPVRDHRCRALLQVSRIDGVIRHGRSELTLEACEQPLLEGAWIEVRGPLTRPQPSAHPLLSDAFRRLAAQGCWSRLRTDAVRLLRQDATPLADARRRIARCFIEIAGEERGSLLAALVLGSAQVSLPESLRDGFRVAGYPMPWRRQVFICPCCWAPHWSARVAGQHRLGWELVWRPWFCFWPWRVPRLRWCARC